MDNENEEVAPSGRTWQESICRSASPESPAGSPIIVEEVYGSSTPILIDNHPSPYFLKLANPFLRLPLLRLHTLLTSF